MKKITFCLMTTCMALAFNPLHSKAENAVVSSSLVISKAAESAEAKTLIIRLNEINIMDKSKLNSSEKKNLRKEVRAINTKLAPLGGGVYLSVGALVLILILLIILL